MKVIDLINMIDKGENVPLEIKVDGDIYEWDRLEPFYARDDGSDLLELSKEYTTREFLQMEVQTIEQEDVIDIDSIEEITIGYVANIDGMGNERIKHKINELIKAIKQLNKKIKEKE